MFKFEIPLAPSDEEQKPTDPQDATNQSRKQGEKKNLIFELHGSQFENRPADRTNKKFKWKNLDYL